MGRHNKNLSTFKFSSKNELIEYLNNNNPKILKDINNLEEKLDVFFQKKEIRKKILSIVEIFKQTRNKKNIYNNTEKLHFGFINPLIEEFKDNIFNDNLKNFFNDMKLDKTIIDYRYLFFNDINKIILSSLEKNFSDFEFSKKTKNELSYSPQNIINRTNSYYEDINVFKSLQNKNLDEQIIAMEKYKNDKIESLKEYIKKYKNEDNSLDKNEVYDLKYEIPEIIANILDDLKGLDITTDSIKEIFKSHLTGEETEEIFKLYSNKFIIDKTRTLIENTDFDLENYVSALNKNLEWLKISSEYKTIFIDFLDNIKKKELSEYLPLIDGIFNLNFNNETFVNKIKEVQNILNNKNISEQEKEETIKNYIINIVSKYTKRYRINSKTNEIEEIKTSRIKNFSELNEIDFVAAGSGELDGIIHNEDSSKFYLNFCTTNKDTVKQQQIYYMLPKIMEKLKVENPNVEIIPQIYLQSMIKDNIISYRKDIKSNKNVGRPQWYIQEEFQNNVKIKESQKKAINVLNSTSFLFHTVNYDSNKYNYIFNNNNIQLFDSIDMKEWNNLNENIIHNMKLSYSTNDSTAIQLFFEKFDLNKNEKIFNQDIGLF